MLVLIPTSFAQARTLKFVRALEPFTSDIGRPITRKQRVRRARAERALVRARGRLPSEAVEYVKNYPNDALESERIDAFLFCRPDWYYPGGFQMHIVSVALAHFVEGRRLD